MPDQDRLVVTPYNPRRRQQIWVLAIAAAILCLFVGLLLGGQWFDWQMKEKRRVQAEYEQLQRDHEEQTQALTSAQLNSQVDSAALETVRVELSRLQGELAESREQLRLYRNLLQKEGVAQGLIINGFDLYRTDTGELEYQLIVQQRAGKLKTVKVTASVQVLGVIGDDSKTFSLKELDSEQDKDTLALEFRYFTIHQGVLQLPDGFEPQNVLVQVWPAGQAKKKVEQEFQWRLEAEEAEEQQSEK
ncbi:hypothetical protein QSV34_14685 [Porticoccus sp. W117]|uniref:DUF6776 family protein n=1 Tax=Porticoccus sp. W117 TaxID=3054777 RepID=UPI002594FA19|nr:DUF6776 family protein [Porticoccus sp. W117]MDM3872597.1 hypothetical protein [Porticoccus sp. W117]